jgi:hypothetical protein
MAGIIALEGDALQSLTEELKQHCGCWSFQIPSNLDVEMLDEQNLDTFKTPFFRYLFRLNDKAQREVDQLISGLHLPESYGAIHVRRQDKLHKIPKRSAIEYYDVLNCCSRDFCTDVFVGTDTLDAVNELRQLKRVNVYTTMTAGLIERKSAKEFLLQTKENPEYKRKEMIRLLADVMVSVQAEHFVFTGRDGIGGDIAKLRQKPWWRLDPETFQINNAMGGE